MWTGVTTMTLASWARRTASLLSPLFALFIAAAIPTASGASSQTVRSAAWPERLVAREPVATPNQAIKGGYLFELVSQTNTPARGPYRLERTNLSSGRVRKGPLFSVGDVAAVSGEVWVFGATSRQPHLLEIDPVHLSVTRTIRLPAASVRFPWIAITAGPDRSIWLGTEGTLRRIDARSGRTIAQLAAPVRLAVGDMALDPSGRYLYVSMANEVKGGVEGGAVIEYDAGSGRELARAHGGPPLSYSVAGAVLTAVPGGVWASFRTGMLGLTIHLRQRDLALQPPPGAGIASTPANGLFHWPMDATTVYGGGSLWLANEAGIVACLDPTTGAVRARERVPASRTRDLIAADPATHRLFALESGALFQIAAPRSCWK